MEEEYGFDLVFRYRVRWRFSDYDGNSCQGGDCYFCDLNFVLGFCFNSKARGATFMKRKS